MPFSVATYLDPGTYQEEVVIPGSGSATSLPLAIGLIGTGSGTKRAVNEAVVRGKIVGEAVTFTSSLDTLASLALRRQSTTTLYENGVPKANTDWAFTAPAATSAGIGPVDLTTHNVMAISLDGKSVIEIWFTAAPATAAAVKTNTTNGVVVPHGATAAATTLVELAASINAALAFMTDAQVGIVGSGYGIQYGAVATVVANKLVITSPTTGPIADVAIWNAYPVANDIIGGTLSFTGSVATGSDSALHAKTTIQLVAQFNAASTYTVDYVAHNVNTDSLLKANANTPLTAVKRIGNFPSMTGYSSVTDFGVSSNNITWAPGTAVAASLLSLAVGAGLNLATNEMVSLSIDGKTTIDIHLAVNAAPPPGWVAPVSTATATAAEVALNINATLAASAIYGPRYANVASVIGSGTAAQVKLTSPSVGTLGIVELAPSASGYAGAIVFGLVSTQLPYDIRGVGTKPATGTTYFITYDYTRPASDYNLPKQFFSVDTALADVGVLSPSNDLSIAVSLAFKNGAPSVYVVQADDHLSLGNPTQLAVDAAMNAAAPVTGITDFVVLDTRNALMVDMWNFITVQNSPTQAHPCRAWYGMAKGTASGDRDTPGTFIYTATTTLAVPSDSPSRGRHILVAPSQGDIEIALENGTTQIITVDGTFLAAAAAARFTARTSVAQSMVNQTITGFTNVSDDPSINTFPTYAKQQRAFMADSGVCVITARAGSLVLLDPLTTERGGGRAVEFEEPQLSTQKDDVVVAVSAALNNNAEGFTPSDLADFILTIKQIIGGVLKDKISAGSIAPYRDASGRRRDLNYATDIQVSQDSSDPRNYNFAYFFNGRYPAKYFKGQYSVDNPFFTSTSTGQTA